MREKILFMLNHAKDLPGFPDVLKRLQNVMDNPKSNFNDIVHVIELDPVLASRIMSVSNSVHYTRGAGPSKSLTTAVNKIGRIELKKIIYPLEFSKLFTNNKIIDYKDFWQHSVGVAIYSQKLSKHLGFSQDESNLAYFAGLIHDVGIMIFAYLIPKEYSDFLKSNDYTEDSLQAIEKDKFGIDHSELGAEFICQIWELDNEIINSVRHHHLPYPEDEKISKSVKLINVADGILTAYGIYNGIEYSNNAFHEGAWLDLGLKLEDTHFLLNEAFDALKLSIQLLSFN